MACKTRMDKALRAISMRSQRSRAYLEAALALTTVVPMLCLCVIMISLFTELLPDSTLLRAGVVGSGGIAGVAGYLMLRVYPANLDRVRNCLLRIVSENLLERAELLTVEQDFSDIEFYLNEVIGGLQKHIARLDEELARSRQLLETIEKQSAVIVAAERQRVMLESLGAACHHISQPMTVLSLFLTRMRDTHEGGQDIRELEACLDAVESISVILRKLTHVSEYRTVPYATYHYGNEVVESTHLNILDIDQERAPAVVSGRVSHGTCSAEERC